MSFRLVPNSVTLNDLERRNSLQVCVTSSNSVAFGAHYVQDAQLSQRDRAAGCVTVWAKSGRQEMGDNILRTL